MASSLPRPARRFSGNYDERVTLRDGTPITLRLVVPGDVALLRASFERLSQASRYARFLSAKATLSDAELTYLTDVDHEQHLAICAVADAGGSAGAQIGLGVARFIVLDAASSARRTADMAIALADSVQHKGLGSVLFLRLVAAARERGIERFRCDVLGDNAAMIGLLAAIAPTRRVTATSGVLTYEVELASISMTSSG